MFSSDINKTINSDSYGYIIIGLTFLGHSKQEFFHRTTLQDLHVLCYNYISYISDLIANSMIHTVLHSKLLLMKLKLLRKYCVNKFILFVRVRFWWYLRSHCSTWYLNSWFYYAIKESKVNIKPSSILPDTKFKMTLKFFGRWNFMYVLTLQGNCANIIKWLSVICMKCKYQIYMQWFKK